MIEIPKTYNYIGCFLTFSCNQKCHYCINTHGPLMKQRNVITGQDWIDFINKLKMDRDDLPVSLQGGEPTLHPDFVKIVNGIRSDIPIDVLTNLQNPSVFLQIDPKRLTRKSKYASIRVSIHPGYCDTQKVIYDVYDLQSKGYHIGIWCVAHPDNENAIAEIALECKSLKIDFRLKEFLGVHEGRRYGTIKYSGATGGYVLRKNVKCKTTELLIAPDGFIHRCHSDLYGGYEQIDSIFKMTEIADIYRKCDVFGLCNPCDVKIKTNRFQIFGHTSVSIKEES